MSYIQFGNKKTKLNPSNSIFSHADELNVKIPTSCGRNGRCHECVVEIKKGIENLTERTNPEGFLKGNFRLACQAKPRNTISEIEFSLLKRQAKILTDFENKDFEIIPRIYKQNDMVYADSTPIDKYEGSIIGIAIDIGTTTVTYNIVNLESGEILYTGSFENPQKFGGSDIMNRISYDGTKFKGELQNAIIAGINYEIRNSCKNLKIRRKHIYELLVVGNSTMRDIFFGIDVQSIGQKPYKSIIEEEFIKGSRNTTALNTTAKNLGLQISGKGLVYGIPLISSHIGADVAADLIATNMDRNAKDVNMLIDIGTNTEVVIGNQNKMFAASCPAGPAFEGGEIRFGMPGYDGAIESMSITKDLSINYSTINNKPVIGICGSGLIDLLAELRNAKHLNHLGAFADNSYEFILDKQKNISINRQEISSLAQAKSANYCGQFITAQKFGIKFSKINEIFLSGAFANYINIENAKQIGFIPNVKENHFTKIGNASLLGATILLLSTKRRNSLDDLIKNIQHIELETQADFFETFVDGCMFKPMQEINENH